MDVRILEERVREYAQAYYTGDALISDEEFDALIDRIRELNPNSPVLTVGWGYDIDRVAMTKGRHLYGIPGSLSKVKTTEEVIREFGQGPVVATPKLDGISVVVYYRAGYFVRALTRGREGIGVDVTNKIRHFVPHRVEGFTGAVRGEFILKRTNYERFYADNPSPRNVAAGIANRKDVGDEEVKRFGFIAYKVFGDPNGTFGDDKETTLERLRQFGFETVDWTTLDVTECTPERITGLMGRFNQGGELLLDGVVLTESHFVNDGHAGIVYHEVAFKVQTETAVTTVLDIVWNATRTGKYVPGVKTEPVMISGALVRNPTGHNAKWLMDRKVGIGAVITLVRSGEVIPHILGTVVPSERFNAPTHCYHCNEPLEMVGTDLYCTNDACPGKELNRVLNWIAVCGETDGVGDQIIETVLEHYRITTVMDLLAKPIDLNSLRDVPGVGDAVLERVTGMFAKVRGEITPVQFLTALSINALGRTNAEKIVSGVGIDAVLNGEYDRLASIKGLPKKVIEGLRRMEPYVRELLPYVRLKRDDGPRNESNGTKPVVRIAITGKLNMGTRNAFLKYVRNLGPVQIEEVDVRRADYLVTNDPHSNSSKNRIAREKGIPVVSETEFVGLIKGYTP